MRRSNGFTLIEMLIVICVISILVLIVIPHLLRGAGHKINEAEIVQETPGCSKALESIAHACLAHPELVNDVNWWDIALSHGHDQTNDPRLHGGWRVGGLHVRSWSEVMTSGIPRSQTWWMYEVFSYLYDNPPSDTPCLFHQQEGERVCHVIFADGHLELLTADGLKDAGITKEPVVYMARSWVSWNKWQKLQKR